MIEHTVMSALSRKAGRWEGWLRRLPLRVFLAGGVLLALGVSLLVFSPKYWLMLTPRPGSFEWSRAQTFLAQVEHPLDLAGTLEPAMKWRVLPALAAHYSGLGRAAVLVLPWTGLVVLLGFILHWLTGQVRHRLTALLTLVLVGTTGGIITITNYLGINDAWLLLALLAVVFSQRRAAMVAAALAGPWIDERFLLGLPLAVVCRYLVDGRGLPGLFRTVRLLLPGVLLYLTVRLGATFRAGDSTSKEFLGSLARGWAVSFPYVPLGWWMGFRAAWLLLAVPFLWLRVSGQKRAFAALALSAAAALGSVTLLASDYTRSTHILLVLLLTAVVLWSRHGRPRPLLSALGLCLGLNLLSPFIWVTYNKQSLIWPAPVEVLRLVRAAPGDL